MGNPVARHNSTMDSAIYENIVTKKPFPAYNVMITCITDKGGGFIMRKRHFNNAGLISIALGAVIIFALILPPIFWWFALGLGLIAFGLCALKK